MKTVPTPPGLLCRCRLFAAALFGISSLVLLGAGLGLSDLLPLPKTAVAESEAPDPLGLPLSVLPKERALRLQAAVDSTALSLGSVFYERDTAAGATDAPADVERKQRALARALSALTFGLEGEVYFTAWQGTRVVHSPLAPDAVNMDFAASLDQRGSAFVLRMEDAAAGGGGFLQVTLPRQMLPRSSQAATPRLTRELDSMISGLVSRDGPGEAGFGPANATPEFYTVDLDTCPVTYDPAAPPCELMVAPLGVLDSTPVEQVVYVRKIPHSDWHIAAFTATDPDRLSLPGEQDFEGLLRKGLFVSGFSLAGLAGLMVAPGRRRE